MRRRRAAENENNGENDNNNNDNNSNNSNNDNHGDQEHADQAEPEQEPPVLERQSTGFFVRWNRRLRRTLIVSAVLLVFFIAYLCLPHYCEPCRSTLDQGEWKTPDHAFPTHYRVREKKKILFNLFQTFELEDQSERPIGELRESFSSWLYELFGAGYVSLYDSSGFFNSVLKFSILKSFGLFGGRSGFIYDNKGQCMARGTKQSVLKAMFSGRKRPVYLSHNSERLSSRKTHLVKGNQRWVISNEYGQTVAEMNELVIIDYWGDRYAGWDIKVTNTTALDPRIPALLVAIDLGSTVLAETLIDPQYPTSSAAASAPATSSGSGGSGGGGGGDVSSSQRVAVLENDQLQASLEFQTLQQRVLQLEDDNTALRSEVQQIKDALGMAGDGG